MRGVTRLTVGEKIKTLRKSLGLTQTELGQRVGVQKNAVSKWECGRVEDIPTSTIKLLANLFNVPASYLIDDDTSPVTSPLLPLPRMKRWQVLGGTACGQPLFKPLEDASVLAPADIDADFVFQCVGDSMINARIFDGDTVFVKEGEVPDGQIGVVRVGEEYTLKRIYHGPDYLELRSENPMYPPIIIRGEQENAEIVGRAVQFLSRVI
jgi:repressor LexA